MNLSTNQNLLRDYKFNVLNRIYTVMLLFFFLGSVVVNALSLDKGTSMLYNQLITAVTSLFMFLLLFIGKKYLKSYYRLHQAIYFMIAVVLLVIVTLMNLQQYFVSSIGMTFVLLLTLLFFFERRLLIFYVSLPIAMLVYFLLKPGGAIVEVGDGYFIALILYLFYFIYASFEVIKMNKWYEQLLIKEIQTVNEKNQELTAYNEEFIATQSELFENYDKIKDLNSDLEATMKQLDTLAYKDQLTSIPNRNGLVKAINDLIDAQKTVRLALIDLKNLKHINNTFGFQAGDHILDYLAKSLPTTLEDLNFIGRVGGDEFGLVFTNPVDPKKLLETLNKAYHYFHTDYFTFTLHFYVGLAISESHEDALNLIKKAELAMYNSKRNKKDYDSYSPIFNQESKEQLLIYSELERAVEEKEIYLVYQPKILSSTKELIGFEALVRWQSELLGFVAPPVFIGISEKTGYISLLGQYIFREACLFVKTLLSINDQLIVSVNVSGIELLEENYVANILAIADEIGIPYHNLAIEVTETAVIEELAKAVGILGQFKALGFHIYLDDFGTGFSSLNYLRQLPIDHLKIDKSFIDPIATNDKAKSMVETILNLAQSLELKLIAEGVETKEQFNLLKKMSCDIVQGYYFDRPLTKEDALQKATVTSPYEDLG